MTINSGKSSKGSRLQKHVPKVYGFLIKALLPSLPFPPHSSHISILSQVTIVLGLFSFSQGFKCSNVSHTPLYSDRLKRSGCVTQAATFGQMLGDTPQEKGHFLKVKIERKTSLFTGCSCFLGDDSTFWAMNDRFGFICILPYHFYNLISPFFLLKFLLWLCYFVSFCLTFHPSMCWLHFISPPFLLMTSVGAFSLHLTRCFWLNRESMIQFQIVFQERWRKRCEKEV